MRRIFSITALICIAACSWAQRGSDVLSKFVTRLSNAESLSAEYTIQEIGGAPSKVKIRLVKPNKARIETASKVIIADGSMLYTYEKAENTLTKLPQTDENFNEIFEDAFLSIWTGFFNPNPEVLSKPIQNIGAVNRRGTTLYALKTGISENPTRIMTYYVDEADNMVRQAELTEETLLKTSSTILNTQSVQLDAQINSSVFKFDTPRGAQIITEADLSARWLTDLNEAKALAKKTNRKIFVDFYADW